MREHIGFTGTQEISKVAPLRLMQLAWSLMAWRHGMLHHGDCIGMDALAHMAAQRLGMQIIVHPPDNDRKRARMKEGKGVIIKPPAPYLVRNRAIVDACDLLIAVPRDPTQEERRSGTWATIRYAYKTNTPVSIL